MQLDNPENMLSLPPFLFAKLAEKQWFAPWRMKFQKQ
jgi:hypothetical protein